MPDFWLAAAKPINGVTAAWSWTLPDTGRVFARCLQSQHGEVWHVGPLVRDDRVDFELDQPLRIDEA